MKMPRQKTESEWKEFFQKKREKQLRYIERHKNRQKAKYESSPNYYLQRVEFSNRSGSHVNCFRYFPNNSKEHEYTKFLVFALLRDLGHDLIVEPIFADGEARNRCDLLDLSTGIIIEILYSEKLEDAKEKANKYPSCFDVRFIDANEELDIDNIL